MSNFLQIPPLKISEIISFFTEENYRIRGYDFHENLSSLAAPLEDLTHSISLISVK
jgi:hypothetical protein